MESWCLELRSVVDGVKGYNAGVTAMRVPTFAV